MSKLRKVQIFDLNGRDLLLTDESNVPVTIRDRNGLDLALESNGGVPVNIQDQHTLALDLNFIQAQGPPTTLASDAAVDDTTIILTSSVGFVDGNVIALFTATGIFYFGKQVGAPAGAVVTLDTPIDKIFTAAATTVIRATDEMAVDGSVTPQIFQIGPVGSGTGVEVDITRIAGYIEDGTAMDDAKFGGITALTYGVVLRQNNGTKNNIWNAKSNGELAIICASDFFYADKAPSGSYGARFRNSYAGQEKHGVTIRLAPGDTLEIIIQDNLTGLQSFKAMAQGHVVGD